MLTLRARVLILAVLVAAVATTATAWLTYRLAAAHIADTRAADDRVIARVTATLVEYAQRNGTWIGVPAVVSGLAADTGQRIEVTTETGVLVGGTPGTAADTAVRRVDPHPQLVFTDADSDTASAVAYLELDAFRFGARLAGCLADTGNPVTLAPARNGVPHVVLPAAGPPAAVLDSCRAKAASTGEERDRDFTAVNACSAGTNGGARASCLRAAFLERTRGVGPEPVLLAIGPRGGGAVLPLGSVVGVVAFVIVCAAVGSAVVSRRALRPVDALTRSARRLGTGGGWVPVAVRGDDQVAELTRTFNAMAASLKRGEEQQRRMIADVAHELRTPLSTLRSYLEGLIDGILPAEPALFASLHDEALLQQRIVDDLQDLALAEAGALAYRKDRVDVADLLRACATALQVPAGKAGVRLEIRTTGRVQVMADPDRLRQVVGNLVGNAQRYTPPGGTITLRCAAAGGTAVIEVTDTGCGIAPDDLPHIFDRFWRADGARGRSSGGGGLGLAIARHIVTDHGGDIEVRSRVGHGTTFIVQLPELRGRSADNTRVRPAVL